MCVNSVWFLIVSFSSLFQMPRGSDRTWNQKMLNAALEKQKKAEKTWKYFNTPRFGSETFIIVHFADKVEYSCEGFLDKNRDTMNDEFVNLLRASDYPLVAQLFHDNAETLTAGKSADKNDRKTASTPTKQSGSTGGAARGTHKSHTQSVRGRLCLFQTFSNVGTGALRTCVHNIVRLQQDLSRQVDEGGFSFAVDLCWAVEYHLTSGLLSVRRLARNFKTR